MNILIIGCKGFIGSHLYSFFLKQVNINLYGADILNEKAENYFYLDNDNPNFEDIFILNQFDLCINCSGAANVSMSLHNPYLDFQLNTLNVFKILDSIRKNNKQCKFLNLSSAAVYGNPSVLPINEGQKLKPLSPYGIHKLYAEQICEEYYTFYGIKTCCIRIFSAYGEGLKKQLFWDLYAKTKQSQTITLYGTGEESRDFIYVSDLCMAIYLISQHSKFEAEIINVANGVEIKIKDAVADFFSNFDTPIKYKFSGEERKGDPTNWCANIDNLITMGYSPKYCFKEGISRYYKWLKSVENV